MTEREIQKSLFIKYRSHKYRFANTYFFENESDFLTYNNSGYFYEFEVKISRSDFLADFKKIRHIKFNQQLKSKSKYYCIRSGIAQLRNPSWEICKEFPELIICEEDHYYRSSSRPPVILSYTPWSNIAFKQHKAEHLPNKFYYAVPYGLVHKSEVPEYAGLLYIHPGGEVSKVKEAPFIHKQVLDPKRLFDKMYYAYEGKLRSIFFKDLYEQRAKDNLIIHP